MLRTPQYMQVERRFRQAQNLTHTSHARAIVGCEFDLDEEEVTGALKKADDELWEPEKPVRQSKSW